MRLSIRTVIEPALALAAGALLALLVIPWKGAPLPPVASSPQPEMRQPPPELQTARRMVSPEAILPLFVGKQTPERVVNASSAPQPAGKPPAAASWLRYMGRSSATDGKSYVYVKDSRSGKVIRASQTEALNGWTLVSEDDAGLVLKNGEDLYTVSKR
jgi:hypothetical protein